SGSGVKIAEGMKKTAPDGAVSGMPAIRETGPGKNLQAITVSTRLLLHHFNHIIIARLTAT
ncbi:hypothetical protein AB9L59_13980, partial [Escherichia coli]|uniref:hypothetical protein n=1 Tax=Escherichia coli TaxID=562 RepID=UPI000BB996BA